MYRVIAVFFNVLVIKRLSGIQENAKHSWSLCSVEFFYYKKNKESKEGLQYTARGIK